jgi:hypothetical protein
MRGGARRIGTFFSTTTLEGCCLSMVVFARGDCAHNCCFGKSLRIERCRCNDQICWVATLARRLLGDEALEMGYARANGLT